MSSGNEVRCLAFTEEGKENLTLVYKLAEERGIKCVWVTQQEAEVIAEKQEEVVYAIDPIEGSEDIENIVKNLVKLKYPVLGPQCLLTALKHGVRLQNDMKYPVYTLTMYGTVVCFSNILTEEREKLVRLVELMGGKVTRPLNGAVTHLVVGEVGSVKYFTAAENNIKIVVKDWIHHLWKVGVSKYVCAKDGKWEEFLCPLFLGCSICMTGFSIAEKSKVQKLIAKFGGEYSGAMKLNETTHLIVNKPEGKKYAMAAKFGVKVINLNWVYDSIEKGYCQDNIKYPVKPSEHPPKPELHQSTPEKSARFMSMADVSSIDPSTINETVASAMNDTSVMSMLGTLGKTSNRLLIFPVNQDYSDILDGIHIFITGFSFQEEEKMGKLLSLAGAIKHTQLTSIVERVVVGDPSRVSAATKNEILAASSEKPDLHVVGQNWVLDSLSGGKCIPEKEYWQSSILPSDYEDTRSHAISDDQGETTIFAEIPTVKKKMGPRPSVADNNGSMLGFLQSEDNDDNMMLSQYQANMGGDDLSNGHEISDIRIKQRSESTRYDHEDMEETCQDGDETAALETTTALETQTVVDGCFHAKTFYITGFDGKESDALIFDVESNGGVVLPGNSKKISDYIVVPLTGWPVDKTANEVVTIFWLKYSIELGQIVDPSDHPMCVPFSVVPDSEPLRGSVTCLSQYKYSERTYLARLIVELGGIVQDIVARRELENLKKTTHLIIREPGGDKYNGCKNWGIPVVNENWVYECARKSKTLDEKDFIVGKKPEPLMEQIPQPIKKPEIPTLSREVKQASYASSWGAEFPPIPRQPSVVNKIRERLEAKHDQRKKALEEAIKNKETPIGVRYKRLNLETPTRFMTKGGTPGNVSFDLTEVFKLLKTPADQQKKVHDEIIKNPETPVSEIISRCLDGGIANIPDHLKQNLEGKLIEQDLEEMEKASPPQKENISTENQFRGSHKEQVSNIFENLVISLATKLHKDYSELGKIIAVHGGEFRWTYDNACTHFLFQGRLNDKNKEFCTAKKEGKIIVTPYWIEACVLAESKLDESLFPHVYDPNKSIQVSAQKSQRTRRSTQQGTRISTRSSNSGTSSTSENDETPKRRTRVDTEQPEDSQEGRDLLKKKLENIMADTSVARPQQVHRLSCGRPSFLSPVQRRASTVSAPVESFDAGKTELSQDVQVSWDDPTGREEMLRLMNKDESTVNVSTLSQAEQEEMQEVEKNPAEMFFLMSSVSAGDKAKYAGIINALGGEFLDTNSFDSRGTHLLVSKPGRSEKYLSALAYGKYILNPSYLVQCEVEGKFVSENKYEFGNPDNPDTERLLQNPEVLQSLIPLSAYRWRTKLDQVKQKTGVPRGAFTGWKIILHVNERQQKGFERLLKCGQAEIIEEHNIFQLGKARDITHAFIDQERAKSLGISFIEDLVLRMGIHVCDPTFIGDYLLKDPQPNPNDYYIQQAVNILGKSAEDLEQSEAKRRKTD